MFPGLMLNQPKEPRRTDKCNKCDKCNNPGSFLIIPWDSNANSMHFRALVAISIVLQHSSCNIDFPLQTFILNNCHRKITLACLLESNIKLIYFSLKCTASQCFLLGFIYLYIYENKVNF